MLRLLAIQGSRAACCAGQTIYLLIEAADGGSGSPMEAAVDDVRIEW